MSLCSFFARLFVYVLLIIAVSIKAVEPLPKAVITLQSSEVIQGVITEQRTGFVVVKTPFGELTVPRKKIKSIHYKREKSSVTASSKPKNQTVKPAGELINIWFDPTGHVLSKGELYFSFLSWGYGVTEDFHVTTAWYRYFLGDLNVRGKYQVFDERMEYGKHSLAVGAHLHTGSQPDKYRFETYSQKEHGYYDESTQSFVEKERWVPASEWVQVGSRYRDGYFQDDNSQFWSEWFAAYTLAPTGQDVNYTLGASFTHYPDEKLMPRLYFAVDANVHENFKIMAEVFYDPYYRPIHYNHDEDNTMPVFFDVGFLTDRLLRVDNLWLGIHFQKPVITGFYRF